MSRRDHRLDLAELERAVAATSARFSAPRPNPERVVLVVQIDRVLGSLASALG